MAKKTYDVNCDLSTNWINTSLPKKNIPMSQTEQTTCIKSEVFQENGSEKFNTSRNLHSAEDKNLKKRLVFCWIISIIFIGGFFPDMSSPYFIDALLNPFSKLMGIPDLMQFRGSFITLGLSCLMLLLEHTYIIPAIHEGLHAIACLWFIKDAKITASGLSTYVHKAKKCEWIIMALFPMLFPFTLFIFIAFADWRMALVVFILLLSESVGDFIDIRSVLNTPCDFISDTQDGLICYKKQE